MVSASARVAIGPMRTRENFTLPTNAGTIWERPREASLARRRSALAALVKAPAWMNMAVLWTGTTVTLPSGCGPLGVATLATIGCGAGLTVVGCAAAAVAPGGASASSVTTPAGAAV